jgi:hypothetical protein
MNRAIEFAEGIWEKKRAIAKSPNGWLAEDYKKSVNSDIKDLKYYCSVKGFNWREVMRKAKGA